MAASSKAAANATGGVLLHAVTVAGFRDLCEVVVVVVDAGAVELAGLVLVLVVVELARDVRSWVGGVVVVVVVVCMVCGGG